MFTTRHASERVRSSKTNIVRTRTGCQNCRKRRRKCDEGRPECQGCVKRGIKCSGYERTIAFKDVSDLAAESSRKFEAARWAALRAEDEQQGRKRRRAGSGRETGTRTVETLSSDAGTDLDGYRSSSSSAASPPAATIPSPRSYRRAPPSTRQETTFSGPSTQQQPIDPALFNLTQTFETSPSFDLDDNPLEPSLALAPYNDTALQPTICPEISVAREQSLIQHFKTHVLPSLPVPMQFDQSYMENSCFRHAILALSSVNQSYLQITVQSSPSSLPSPRMSRSAVGREHYLAAVCGLYRYLDLSDPVARQQHAAAALMLAYYEIETGSPFGSLRHAHGLDALLSKLDLTPNSASIPATMPEIFKAWRILRYDVRHISAPWRLHSIQTDPHDAYAFLDPQLAIRDVYTLAWNLIGRMLLEASFTPSPAKGSSSKQCGIWVRDVAGRACDRRNVERQDWHRDEMGADGVLSRCERFTRALDQWHASLGSEGKPVVKTGTAKPFVAGEGGAAFEPIVVLKFAGGDGPAAEYMMYVAARLFVSYLLTVYATPGCGQASSPAETAAWARMLMGVVCGMRLQQMRFSYVCPVDNVAEAAILCEGVGMITSVLDGVIPHVLGQGIPMAELAEWLYLKKGLEVVRRERLRGKNIRAIFLTLDEDYEKGHFDTRCAFLGFGDYSGKGYFRDIYSIDGEA